MADGRSVRSLTERVGLDDALNDGVATLTAKG